MTGLELRLCYSQPWGHRLQGCKWHSAAWLGSSVRCLTISLTGLCFAAKMEGDPRLQTLFSSTCGVLFMGTPHQGSSLAPWAQGIAGTLGFVKQTNRRLLKVLRTDSELLSRVNEAFLTMVKNRKAVSSPLFPIRICCFFEELPLPVVGLVRVPTFQSCCILAHTGKIVPRASAVLPGHIIVGVRGNHRDMARFRQLDDRGFLSVAGELKECIRSANMQRRPVEVPVQIPSPALTDVQLSPTPCRSASQGRESHFANTKCQL